MLPGWDRLQDLRGGKPVPTQPKPDAITQAIADATDHAIAGRVILQTARQIGMERLKEKLAKAAGVAPRLTVAIEKDADDLIARETEMMARKNKAFAGHNEILDSHKRDLNQLEDALKVVENGVPNSEG